MKEMAKAVTMVLVNFCLLFFRACYTNLFCSLMICVRKQIGNYVAEEGESLFLC